MSVSLKVVALKGQVIPSMTVSVNITIDSLKREISSRMYGQKAEDVQMRLIYKAKPLDKMTNTRLIDLGIQPNAKKVQMHIVARWAHATSNAMGALITLVTHVVRGSWWENGRHQHCD